MNILVTGGAGYIGSHTARLLDTSGHHVVIYDNLSKGHEAAVGALQFVQGDIADTALLEQTLRTERIDAVIHFAASSLVGESMEKPREYYRNNVMGTLNLLDAMLRCDVKQLVFSSTAAVYGEPETEQISETAAKRPTNVYGRTKWIMEQAMADYAKVYGLRYKALRYFNACGADPAGDIGEDHQPETHLIPLVLQTCLGQRAAIKIFGTDYPTADGTCVRDYIHVNDLAKAHLLAVEALADGQDSGAYNLGNGNGFSVRQIIEAAEEVSGVAIRKEDEDRRAGDPAVLVASAAKIREELGWQAEFTDIKEIIATAWNWHKKNPRGFAAQR